MNHEEKYDEEAPATNAKLLEYLDTDVQQMKRLLKIKLLLTSSIICLIVVGIILLVRK
jgi:hypothetical protein